MKPNNLVALIDADSIIHIVAYNYRDCEDPSFMFAKVGEMVQQILSAVNCSEYQGFIGGTRCFRYDLAKTKPYKGNRPAKPEWIQKWEFPIKAYLRDTFAFIVCDSVEADDAVSIYSRALAKEGKTPLVCGCDKDLKTIPGNHYDYKKQTFCHMSETEAARLFWKQMVTGDSTDGILGCRGKGPKAAEILDTTDNVGHMRRFVEQMYHAVYGFEWETIFQEMHSLLFLLEEPAHGFIMTPLQQTEEAYKLQIETPSFRPMHSSKVMEDIGIFD